MTATMTAERKSELAGMPQPYDFAWAMLRALHVLGGRSTARADIEELAFAYMGLTAERLRILKPDGSQTEVSNRAAWAMTYLSWANLVRNTEPRSGVWQLMPGARKIFTDHPLTDDVKREAWVRGVTYGAKRTHEGIEQGRIQVSWSS
jgi:restriction endonuclease Mrr